MQFLFCLCDWFGLVESGLLAVWSPELFCLCDWFGLVESGRVWSVGCVVTRSCFVCDWFGLVESGLLAVWSPELFVCVVGSVWSSLVCWLCGYPELFCL